MLPYNRKGRAFTLVELLLYIGMFAGIMGIMASVFVMVVTMNTRETKGVEVSQELEHVVKILEYIIQQSSLVEKTYEGLSEATPCSQYCSVKIRTEDSATDPTIIRSDANGVYIKKGVGSEEQLTSSHIKIDQFILTKYDIAGGHATLEVNASFTYGAENPELAVTRAIKSAIGRVSAATFDSDLLPDINDSRDIGQPSPELKWKNVFLSGIFGLGTYNVDPGGGIEGSLYYNTVDKKPKYHDGTNWYEVSPWNVSSTSPSIGFLGGNVGIGTTGPQRKLHIVKTAVTGAVYDSNGTLVIEDNYPYINLVSPNNTSSGIFFGDPEDANVGRIAYIHSTNDMYFNTNDAEAMRITSGGNIGIGLTNPQAKLHIGGVAGTDGIMFPDNTLQKTALPDPGAAGEVLTSNGAAWVSVAAGGSGGQSYMGNSQWSSGAVATGGWATHDEVINCGFQVKTIIANAWVRDGLGGVPMQSLPIYIRCGNDPVDYVPTDVYWHEGQYEGYACWHEFNRVDRETSALARYEADAGVNRKLYLTIENITATNFTIRFHYNSGSNVVPFHYNMSFVALDH